MKRVITILLICLALCGCSAEMHECKVVAHTSDEDAQRIYQEHLERKKRKEKEWEE